MAIGAVLYMQGYINGGYLLTLGFVLELGSGAISLIDYNYENENINNNENDSKN